MKTPRGSKSAGPDAASEGKATQTAGCPLPRPVSLSAEDDALLLDLAQRIHRRGLTTPALLCLEGLHPVSFLGSQLMHFMNPFVQMLVSSATFTRLAGILEERSHLERLLRHLEAVAKCPETPPREGS
jgi:hypothetical protein